MVRDSATLSGLRFNDSRAPRVAEAATLGFLPSTASRLRVRAQHDVANSTPPITKTADATNSHTKDLSCYILRATGIPKLAGVKEKYEFTQEDYLRVAGNRPGDGLNS